MAIIICGTEDDPHVKWVKQKIEQRNGNVIVFDYQNLSEFYFYLDSDGCAAVSRNGDCVDIDVIWYRVKLRQIQSVVTDEDRARYVQISEWLGFYKEICALFADKVVNPIQSIRFCSSKIGQQKLAFQCGLSIPSSLVSTDLDQTKSFYHQYGKLITKSMGNPNAPKSESHFQEGIVTTSVGLDFLRSVDRESFISCPTHFQNMVEKSHELRIVVIQKKFFTFRIDSQKFKSTSVDWRFGNDTLEFKPCRLPKEIQSKILTFMDFADLVTGSFDFIVTPSGEYVFLECNPDGQWGWLEPAVDGKISSGFADMLIDIAVERSKCAA